MNHQLRQRTEVAIVRQLLQSAAAQGFQPISVHDGETNTDVTTHDDVMRVVFNLDDCTIRFKRRKGDACANWVKITLGNGDECVSDYGDDSLDGGHFKSMMEQFHELISNGVITFSPCPQDSPAWTNWAGRGVCIGCGCDRHITPTT